MKRLLAAIGFLTVLPVPSRWVDENGLAGSVPLFPFVGLIVGAVAGGAGLGLWLVLPPWPAAVIVVLVLAGLSGGLHLDGLSDTADGFLGGRRPDRVLEIMRDSHIGAMGALAVVGAILLKVSLVASLPAEQVFPAVLLAPVAGRCAMVVNMAALPYARSEGLGSVFYRKRPLWGAFWALAFVTGAGWLLLEISGAVAGAAAMLAAVVWAGCCRRKIGGATGDTLGACSEIGEVVLLLVVVAAPRLGELIA